jgi:hypothetical protein
MSLFLPKEAHVLVCHLCLSLHRPSGVEHLVCAYNLLGMKPLLVIALSLFWSIVPLVSSRPETQKSKKKPLLPKIIEKACRGDLYEAYKMTDHVRTHPNSYIDRSIGREGQESCITFSSRLSILIAHRVTMPAQSISALVSH